MISEASDVNSGVCDRAKLKQSVAWKINIGKICAAAFLSIGLWHTWTYVILLKESTPLFGMFLPFYLFPAPEEREHEVSYSLSCP